MSCGSRCAPLVPPAHPFIISTQLHLQIRSSSQVPGKAATCPSVGLSQPITLPLKSQATHLLILVLCHLLLLEPLGLGPAVFPGSSGYQCPARACACSIGSPCRLPTRPAQLTWLTTAEGLISCLPLFTLSARAPSATSPSFDDKPVISVSLFLWLIFFSKGPTQPVQ